MAGVRPARESELTYLENRMRELGHERVDLRRSMVWVSEDNGLITGMICQRLVWQMEPHIVFPEVTNKTTRRRSALLLAKAAESFIADRMRNTTGIFSYFFVTKSRTWAKLAEHFGCTRIYKRCMTLGRDV
jgi:hypothetical protein